MIAKKSFLIFIVHVVLLGAHNDQAKITPSSMVYDSGIEIHLQFERIPTEGLDPFRVIAKVSFNQIPITQASLTATLSRGIRSSILNRHNGTYEFSVTPDITGEYEVSVTFRSITVTRTILVLQDIHSDWNQPQSVSGYVNTEGYEDGVTISPDGQYLFVHTGPYRWSGILVYGWSREEGGCGNHRLEPTECTHPWVNEIIGSITAPERPGFYSNRFSGSMQRHNAESWGIGDGGTPNYAMTTMFYGFKRQEDGSFKEPFFMAFDDLEDGLIGPFGLTFMPNEDGSHTTLFSLKDSFTTDLSFDLYVFNAVFGENNNFGTYEFTRVGNPPRRSDYFPSTFLDLGDNSGTQGNPFLYYNGQEVESIWTDDEYDHDADTHKISVYVLESGTFPATSTWEKVVLPSQVNQPGTEAIQPTLFASKLFFTQNTNIAISHFTGQQHAADLSNNALWSLPEVILQKDTTPEFFSIDHTDIGKILAIGEPTVALINGLETLYFVYAYIRDIDPITGLPDLDFQAGFVSKNRSPAEVSPVGIK